MPVKVRGLTGRAGSERGYAMAALLVSLSIMAVMMTAAMPVWKQMAQREKEAELVFRGEQYARAIGLFQRKNGPGSLPPSVDVLVEQRYLRKKYKDPITNDDFAPIQMSVGTQPGASQPGGTPGAGGRGSSQATQELASAAQRARGSQSGTPGAVFGSVTGVTSKSKEKSIRIYNGRNHYNEWQFVFTPPPQAPGTGGGTPGAPGVGGQRGRGSQGRGTPQGATPFSPGSRGAPGSGRGSPNAPVRGAEPPGR